MLLVINDDVLEGIKINKNGFPAVPDLYTASYSTYEWPYVYVQSVTLHQRTECELGYWNNITLSKRISPIVYDNVSILSIIIVTDMVPFLDRWHGISYKSDHYNVYYHYEITIELKKGNDSCKYILQSDDYKEIDLGRKDCSKMNTMKRLFVKVIPMINNYISCGHPIQQLNKQYVQSWLPQRNDNFIERCFIHDYNRLKQIIFSSKLINKNELFYLEIGRGMMHFVNPHISDIISNILGVKFIRDISNDFIYGDVTKINKEINNLNLLLPYCLAKLFFNAEKLYSSEKANEEIMLAVTSDINSNAADLKPQDIYCPSINVTKMFDFIYNIEAVHRIKGEYRVGRDDIEYKVKYIKFPLKDFYTPNRKLIELINTVLKIKLEYCNDNPKCYIYAQEGKREYVAWLARDQDCGSEELKESSMNKILNRCSSIFKRDINEFELLCEEYKNSSA